jgi:GNAT superfamily N-acetyltransferase/DNA-binding transcriptional ArsR family regulator
MPAATAPRPEATVAEARALAHPLRLRIIRLLYDRSLTNRELARALGEHPATVLHHVRTLLRSGFIAADPERRGLRGTVEKPYRSTGRSWFVSIDDDHALADVSRAALDAFLVELREAQPSADLHTSRIAVNLTAEQRQVLDDRLAALLGEYATQPPDTDSEAWGVFVATHRRASLPTDDPVLPATSPRSATDPELMPDDVEISDCAPDERVAMLLVHAQWAELSARYGEPDPEPSSIRDPSAFVAPTGAFMVLRVAGEAAGCGGFCRYEDATAELKAIYVSPLQRGHGYSRFIVEALEARAVGLGYRAVRLETGDAQPEAIALYTRLGYSRIPRYGMYRDSPRSVCFERAFEPAPKGALE